MSGSPRTAAGRALLDRVSPPVGDNVDPEEEWVAEAWAHRNEIEGAILAIEAEAATPGESRTLVEAVEREVRDLERPGGLHGYAKGYHDSPCSACGLLARLRAALAKVPVIPDELGEAEAAVDRVRQRLADRGQPQKPEWARLVVEELRSVRLSEPPQ